MLLRLLFLIFVIWIIYVLITTFIAPNPMDNNIESYGGDQEICEKECFDSPYYAACINECMDPVGDIEFNGPREFTKADISSPIPLGSVEEGDYISTRLESQYKYDYPGK